MAYLIIHAAIITTDSKFREVQPANGLQFTPEELIGFVHGHIKIIPLKGEYKGKVLVMASNAEAKKLGFEFNKIASELAQRTVLGAVLVCERKLLQ